MNDEDRIEVGARLRYRRADGEEAEGTVEEVGGRTAYKSGVDPGWVRVSLPGGSTELVEQGQILGLAE